MRELTFLETGYLAGGLLVCLLLPLLMSYRGSREAAARRSCMRTVWAGQAVLAVAGLIVLASVPLAPYAAAFGLAGYTGCAVFLYRRCPAAHAARNTLRETWAG